MRSIYKKINISPSFLFILLISFISGLFKDVLSFLLIILIHEIGHVICSIIYNWKIDKIDITLCGGFITYNDIIDKPFKEELLIAISGFISQIILFFILFILNDTDIIGNKIYLLINKYNISIMLFNLIPIYPLDGSKIIFTIFNMFIPYKISLKLINIISLLEIIIIFLIFLYFKIKIEYSYIIILTFIIQKIIKHIKEMPYMFNKLLFERYFYPIKTNKYNYIEGDNLSLFKRQRKNVFKIKNHYITERRVLSKMFD